MNRPKVIAVIPAYNEQAYISDVVTRARKYVSGVIVVDDGSSDHSAEVALTAGANVIKHNTRRGAGATTRTGFEAALKDGADIIVTLDGDGQHNPDEIPQVIAPVIEGRADLAIGSRFLGGKTNIPRYRKFGIDVITFLYNFGSTRKVADAQSCFRAHSRRLLEAINITENGFGFSVQVLIQARRLGFSITEVPVSCLYHPHGSSMNPLTHGLGVAWNVIRLRLKSLC